ncbi:undecaprenyl-diphosphate phosphatase, partial [Treponema endosymbiont of Eucomonympha sp.]|uniref:undecaprenyl-diphosphate phosphatase n=1 Tax=Treponema endosymbiont of Eucomonympha sp. TaxID=1580831 RepID=UPI001EE6F279
MTNSFALLMPSLRGAQHSTAPPTAQGGEASVFPPFPLCCAVSGGAYMTVTQALLLGLLQGVTEFLPVSSSGHLA